MPDLSHLWQRFVLAVVLVFGLLVGVGATIFGYSNTATVDVGFALWHVSGVPLWTVALVPLAVALVVGTLYHWWNSLHHFTQHMQHRRRVRDLEAEVAALKEHLDHLLDIPDQGATPKPAQLSAPEPEAEPEPEPEPASEGEAVVVDTSNGTGDGAKPATKKKAAIAASNGDGGGATPESSEAANS